MSDHGGVSPAQVSGARPRWLVVDSRRVNTREYRRLAPNVVVLGIALLVKLVRLRMKFPQAVPYEARFMHVDADALPGWARRAIDAMSSPEQGRALSGFEARFHYTLEYLGTTESYARVLVDPERSVMLQLMTSRTVPLEPKGKVDVRSFVVCHTKRAGGWIATSNNTAHFDVPDVFDGEIVAGDAARVLERHRERIAGRDVTPFGDDDGALDAELAAHHHAIVTYLMERGVYVEPDGEELDELERKTTAARSLGRD